VLGADGHLHPKEADAATESPAEHVGETDAERLAVDATDPVVMANRERLEALRHERYWSPDMADVIASPEGRVATVGIAVMLVLRVLAFAVAGTVVGLVLGIFLLFVALCELVSLIARVGNRLLGR
jgi:hypothetical protein